MKVKRIAIAIGIISIIATTLAIAWKPVSHSIFVRTQMELEIHPLWKDLNSGRFKQGSKLEDVLALHTPYFDERTGPYSVLTFYKDYDGKGIPFSGLTIAARDGELIYAEAASCTWNRTFFDGITANDHVKMAELANAAQGETANQRDRADQP